MDLQGYVRAVRKSWWIIALACVIGINLGGAAAAIATPQYRSTVVFFVSTPSSSTGSSLQADQFAQRRVSSYVGVLTSDRVAELVVQQSRTDESVSTVRASIGASADLNTVLLTATVTTNSSQRSQLYASVIANQFGGVVNELDGRGATDKPEVVFNVLSGPTAASSPVSPRVKLDLAVGFAAGLVLGLFLALARELVLSLTIRSQDVLRASAESPVLATVPFDKKAKHEPLAAAGSPGALRAEAFRQLRTNLSFIDVARPARMIVVTSASAGEGKTTTAVNLALAMASGGQRVLLLDADLRRPRVASSLKLPDEVGLTTVLSGAATIGDVVQPFGPDQLDVMGCGAVPPNPSELLGTPAMAGVLAAVRSEYDTVVIDTPPLLPVTDAAVVALQADGAVIVVRHGRTRRTQVESAVRSLQGVNARVLGAILSMVPLARGDTYDAYGFDARKNPHPDVPAAEHSGTDATEPDSPETPNPGGASAHGRAAL